MPPTSLFVSGTFGVLSVLLAAELVFGVFRAGQRLGEDAGTTRRWTVLTAVGLLLWLGVTRALAASGKLSAFESFPPPLFRVLLVAVVLNATLVFSKFGKRLLRGLPLWGLIAFQAFRIPVELALFSAHRDGLLPAQMTFEGWNFDIVSGLTAIPVAWLAARGKLSKRALLAWNVVSLGLLFTIVAVSILSAPVPFRLFRNEPSSQAVTTAGLVWLPTFLVQAALFGHLLVFRWLAQQRSIELPAEKHPAQRLTSIA